MSLLLLCGCLVSFSSVSSAESYTDVLAGSYNEVTLVGSNNSNAGLYVTLYTGATYPMVTSYDSDGNSCMGTYVTNCTLSLNFYNNTGYYATFDAYQVTISLLNFIYNNDSGVNWGNTYFANFSHTYGDAVIISALSDRLNIRFGKDVMYNNGVLIAPSVPTTFTVSFDIITNFNIYGTNVPNANVTGRVDSIYGSVNGAASTSITTYPNYKTQNDIISGLGDGIQGQTQQQQQQHQEQMQQEQQQHQEQMQQQQQQHEEQMQQSQEQYDEFTDDGSAEGESFITGTDSTVKEKIGIFTFLDTMLENLLGLFDAPDGDAVITFPAFSMEIGGETHQIWADTQFNLTSLDDDFSVLLTAVRFGTVATVYFALINFLGDTYSRIFGGKSE